MYAEHMPIIREYANTARGFADVVSFAIATQNMYFYRVKHTTDTIRYEGIDATTLLLGRQKCGIVHIWQHAQKYLPLPCCTLAAMQHLVELPSVGIVKAGFILQMCGYSIGCLDRHNLSLAGLDTRVFARMPVSAEALSLRLRTYIAVCEQLGGAAYLWDSWCMFIAAKYPRHFSSAEEVSAYHVCCVVGSREERLS